MNRKTQAIVDAVVAVQASYAQSLVVLPQPERVRPFLQDLASGLEELDRTGVSGTLLESAAKAVSNLVPEYPVQKRALASLKDALCTYMTTGSAPAPSHEGLLRDVLDSALEVVRFYAPNEGPKRAAGIQRLDAALDAYAMAYPAEQSGGAILASANGNLGANGGEQDT